MGAALRDSRMPDKLATIGGDVNAQLNYTIHSALQDAGIGGDVGKVLGGAAECCTGPHRYRADRRSTAHRWHSPRRAIGAPLRLSVAVPNTISLLVVQHLTFRQRSVRPLR